MARAGGAPDLGRFGTTDGTPMPSERRNHLALGALSDHLDGFPAVPTERFQADVERLLGIENLGYSDSEIRAKVEELNEIIKGKKYNTRILGILGSHVERLKSTLRDRPKAANDDAIV